MSCLKEKNASTDRSSDNQCFSSWSIFVQDTCHFYLAWFRRESEKMHVKIFFTLVFCSLINCTRQARTIIILLCSNVSRQCRLERTDERTDERREREGESMTKIVYVLNHTYRFNEQWTRILSIYQTRIDSRARRRKSIELISADNHRLLITDWLFERTKVSCSTWIHIALNQWENDSSFSRRYFIDQFSDRKALGSLSSPACSNQNSSSCNDSWVSTRVRLPLMN